ncbi:acetate--CoA ligase family protein [Ramlibacter sp.]|uniref:acetate--CoA ligase family protein n=1 Tax=Ramlibacter sp. TaxID=1917967 RepID=UPI003D15119D
MSRPPVMPPVVPPGVSPERVGLSAMFAPQSVAIVGASDDRERLSGRPLRYLIDAGYRGRIYPINPRRTTVQGLPAFVDLASLPEAPDLALIVVSAPQALDAIGACIARGVRAAYLLSGGFAEGGAEGAALQERIGAMAREAGMRLLGPNCLGAFNAETRFCGTFASSLERGLPRSGPLAVVSQSGAYGQHLAYLAQRRGLGIKYLITTGNEIDIDLAECIEWLAQQPEIGAILAYAEGARNGAALMRALQAAQRAAKPVVFLKVGASDAGAHAASSHTAVMAGSDRSYSAVLAQFGAWRAASTEEQIDIAYACCQSPALAGRNLTVVSVSGGFGVQAADAADAAGLALPALTEAAAASLRELLPGSNALNPIDVTGQAVNDVGLLSRALAIAAQQDTCEAIVVCLTTVPLARELEAPVRRAVIESTAAFRASRPVVVLAICEHDAVAAYEAAGVLVFEDANRAIRALGALSWFRDGFERARRASNRTDAPKDGAACEALRELPAGPVSERDARRLLRAIGIAAVPEAEATSAEAAVAASDAFGYPVALKMHLPGVLHKTEVGGVLLDLADAAAVRRGFATLLERCGQDRLAVLVSPMSPPGIEVILGVARDPTFGPVVMFGLGGVTAECFQDTALRAAPVDEREALRMIEQTKAGTLLKGWRGGAPADVDSVVRALVALSRFGAQQAGHLETIEINPFRVLPAPQGGHALDALIVRSPA